MHCKKFLFLCTFIYSFLNDCTEVTLISDNLTTLVIYIMQQVIIGLDTMEILSEMDISGPSEIDFGIEEIEDEDGDIEEDDGEEDKDDDDDDDDTV